MWFTVDMGVVTSLSYKKGGSEDLFNKDGLPLELEVTLNCKDLYPTLMAVGIPIIAFNLEAINSLIVFLIFISLMCIPAILSK